jgi:hypothetical protein
VMPLTEAAATSSRRCAVFAVHGVELAATVYWVRVLVCSVIT